MGATAKQQKTHPKVMTKMFKKCSTAWSEVHSEKKYYFKFFQRYITIVTDLYPVHIGYKVFEETLKKLNQYLLWLYQILPLLDLEKLPSPVKGHI